MANLSFCLLFLLIPEDHDGCRSSDERVLVGVLKRERGRDYCSELLRYKIGSKLDLCQYKVKEVSLVHISLSYTFNLSSLIYIHIYI